jgi:hypothetical protein
MYLWQEPYQEAVQETDETKIPNHLLEASAAIEQRLLSPIDESSQEYRAILNTWLGIQTLRRQHRGLGNQPGHLQDNRASADFHA